MFLLLYNQWGLFQAKLFCLLCGSNFGRLGRRSTICLPVRLAGARHISIGESVYIGANSWLQVIYQSSSAKNGDVLQIHDKTSIAGSCTISAACSIIIERNVLIAGHVYISDHRHAYQSEVLPIREQGVTQLKPVRVCEGAWLGQNAVICPGVTVGKNAVIGANSVVRSNVPDHCVAAGAPARIIRRIQKAGQ